MNVSSASNSDDSSALLKELEYYRKKVDELAGQAVRSDSVISRAKRELKQRRQGFALLTELHQVVTTDMNSLSIFKITLEKIEKQLKMDRSVILRREGKSDIFKACCSRGFPFEVSEMLLNASLSFPSIFQDSDTPLLVTQATPPDPFITALRESFQVSFFVCAPIQAGDQRDYYLLSGRMREAKPFFPPLDEGDVNTVQSLAGFLGAALHNSDLYAHTERMAKSFARFVPSEILEFLSRKSIVDVEIGDQTQREMTILFSDIRSFTTRSEGMTPTETFAFINRYLSRVAPVIRKFGGFIDKFIGDAVMALFPGNPGEAIRASHALHVAVSALNEEMIREGQQPIATGVGLHTGLLMLGTIGFEDRMEGTVISDAVNLASRIEGLTKLYNAPVLITGQTLQAADLTAEEKEMLRQVDRVAVMGKSEPVDIYEVFLSLPEERRQLRSATASRFAEGFFLWTQARFTEAATAFETVLELDQDDRAAKLHLERCRKAAVEGVDSAWHGVAALDHK